MKLPINLLALLLLTSCSSGLRNELGINCLCSITEHFVASTNEEDNRTKEFSFTNSPVFELGVPKEDFATSCAVLINLDSQIDSSTIIKISLIKDKKGRKKTSSYRYDIYELGKITPTYVEINKLMNSFVENLYNKQYEDCYNLLGFEIEKDQYEKVMNHINGSLEEGYVDTRIIGFDKVKDTYVINGAIHLNNNNLNLFTMKIAKRKEGLKIMSFKF